MRPCVCLRAPLAWPFLFIVLFSSYIGGVLATGLAGGFERVVFYYVYRSAVTVWGVNQNRILPRSEDFGIDCTIGTHRRGGCNFVDVNDDTLNPDYVAQSGINLDNPEAFKAANLVNRERKHTKPFRLRRMMPACGGDYPKCITLMKRLYKEIHAEAKKQGLEKDLKGADDQIKKSINEISKIRLWEQTGEGLVYRKRNGNGGDMGDFEKRWGVEPVLSKDGVYEHDEEPNNDKKIKVVEIDVEKTLARNPEAFGKNPRSRARNIAGYISAYGASTDDQVAQRHRSVYRPWQAFKADMQRFCE
ncbi:hypothetical protein ACHAQA_008234 [Verticillium albo-atrum]